MRTVEWKCVCRRLGEAFESRRDISILNSTHSQEAKNLPDTESLAWCLLAIALVLGSLSCGVCERPFISSISPGTAISGGNQFVLTVNGGDFHRDSLVVWSGSVLVTGFVSSHQLVVEITAAEIAQAGSVLVFVVNPGDGTTSVSGAIGNVFVAGCAARDSNAVTFTIAP